MIRTYTTKTGQPIVGFRGDIKELKDDLVRIMYTMAIRDSSSHKAMIEACSEVDAMLKRDCKMKLNSAYGQMVTEALDEH